MILGQSLLGGLRRLKVGEFLVIFCSFGGKMDLTSSKHALDRRENQPFSRTFPDSSTTPGGHQKVRSGAGICEVPM